MGSLFEDHPVCLFLNYATKHQLQWLTLVKMQNTLNKL